MSPAKRRPPKKPGALPPVPKAVQVSPDDDQYEIVYFKRHADDDPDEEAPGKAFLDACPTSIRAKLYARLVVVAAAPPERFAGGGYWEIMHGEMAGYFELRVDGPPFRTHYRLFCRLDSEANDWGKLLVVITGNKKPFRTTFSPRYYSKVRQLGREYFARNPRSIIQ